MFKTKWQFNGKTITSSLTSIPNDSKLVFQHLCHKMNSIALAIFSFDSCNIDC